MVVVNPYYFPDSPLLRGIVSKQARLNRVVIPAKHAGQARGATYSFRARARARAGRGAYRLRVVGRDGSTSWLAPARL